MEKSNEMLTIRPVPPRFPLEARPLLEGLNLSAAQQKALTLLEIEYLRKIAELEIEFLNRIPKILDQMDSKV